MVLALPGEAVAAVEVAAVGDVQAERLDVAGIIFELSGDVRIDVRREQLFDACIVQRCHEALIGLIQCHMLGQL